MHLFMFSLTALVTVALYTSCGIFQATITQFYSVLLKILCRLWLAEKCLFSNFKNTLPTLVFAFFEQGGLNQIVFFLHFLSLLFSSCCASFGEYLRTSVKPLSFSALLSILIDLLNIFSLDDVSNIYLAIDFGSSFNQVFSKQFSRIGKRQKKPNLKLS